eukprot:CAMPEP_0171367642 /NCGR_PEP_ID=MMETSP0879-20121228/6220_1 /TAXON_ID=67004 /ORGANISM="Thalassiosira weissflogii, Strain CCMP1336" /LENGTH=490 /DNA_ID=CAMNT_0011875715 /DNA_START=98 /DNA_END=1570 /DNA_ORIENTATION=+
MKPPTRPYSEYNIFFQLERNYILQKVYHVPPEVTANCNSNSAAFSPNDPDYHGPPLPRRYKDVVLPRRFYSCYKNEDEQVQQPRRHRVSHGKISFADLSKMISSQWKDADDETKEYCRVMRELDRRKFDELKLKFEEESQSNEEISGGENEHSKEDVDIEDDPVLSGHPKSPISDAPTANAVKVASSQHSVTSSMSSSSSSGGLSFNEGSAKRRKIEILYQCAMDGSGVSSAGSTTAAAASNQSSGRKNERIEDNLKSAAKKSPPSDADEKGSAAEKAIAHASSHGHTEKENTSSGKSNSITSFGSVNSNQVRTKPSSPPSKNAYPSSFNIFCQLERAFILQRELHIESQISHDNEFNAKKEGFSVKTTNHEGGAVGKAYLAIPSRYEGLFIRAGFYFAYGDKDLKDAMFYDVRLSNGVTCTYDLSECIARRWLREVDAETKRFCDQMHHNLKKKAGELACKARGAPAATPDDAAAGIYANVLYGPQPRL